MKTPHSLAAVLTGDIVGSTRHSADQLRGLPEMLHRAGAAAAAALPDAGISAVDVFRGDSWQMLVGDPSAALHAALLIRSFLLGGAAIGGVSWDTRIGFGLGEIETLDARSISQSHGAAFIASGAALDGLGKSRFQFALDANGFAQPVLHRLAETQLILLDALLQDWTSKQAWAVFWALHDLTQEKISAHFQPPISQRVVARHLAKAHWSALQNGLGTWALLFRPLEGSKEGLYILEGLKNASNEAPERPE